jgi:adenylate cyclase
MVDETLRRAVRDHIVGTPEFTAEEIEVASGVPLEEAERLWTELGFPRIDPTERFFTSADVAVLATLRALQSTGLARPEVAIAMTRVLGQTMARVAMAQAQNIALVIDEEDASSFEPHEITAALDGILPMFDTFISYVWRRHLAAALGRRFDDRPTEVVGFADIVGYTRLTAEMEPGSLHELVARFQEIANQHVTTEGGRVLKVIGDAVMFVAPDATRAARAAIGIGEAAHGDPALPEVRIGLATGPVVEVEGDFCGETVNRASRLVELALPGTVVVDDETGTALFDGDLQVRPMRPRKLKGLGPVPTWVVRPPRPVRAQRADGEP